VTGVDSNHTRRSMLEQAIREAARRGSDVKTDFICNLDVPMFKRLFELEAAASHVFQVFAEKANISLRVHSGAGFFYFLPSDQNFSR